MLDPELEPTNSLLQPMKSHVAGLRHLRLDGLISQTHRDFIVAMNRGGRLRVPKVGEHLALFDRDLGSGKCAPVLCFLYGRTDNGDTGRMQGNWGIKEGGVVRPGQMVKGPGHASSVGPGKERGITEHVEGHGRGPEDLDPVAVHRRKAKKTVQVGHGREGGGGLCAGQRTGGGEEAAVHTAPVIQEIAYCYLQLLPLGSGGGWGVNGGGRLRGGRTVNGGVIDGGGRGRFDPVGAKAEEQSVHVSWIGKRESALGAIVGEGEAQELGGNGVRFDMIKTGKTRDKIIVVVTILVFDTKIVDD